MNVTEEAQVTGALSACRAGLRRRGHRRQQRGHRLQRPHRGDHPGDVEPQPEHPLHGLLPGGPRGVQADAGAGHGRQSGVYRLEEQRGGGQERGGLQRGEGGGTAPRPLPRRGGRRGGHPRQHGAARRRPGRQQHLGRQMAGRARRHLRPAARPARGVLPQPHHPEGERLPRGHRRGGVLLPRPPPRRPRAACSRSTAGCRPRMSGRTGLS